MTRVCILGDTHFGVRNDNILFHDHFEVFFKEMVNDLIARDINVIIQLGDLFDRRKYINFNTLSRSKQYFFDLLANAGITLHTLVGNHDAHFRETLEVNSSSLVLGEYMQGQSVFVYEDPTTITIGNTTIDVIPWICKDNEQDVMKFMANSRSDICVGHFEIASFSMYKGVEAHGGLPIDMFEKYEHVFSGHYHTRSKKGNITYVGTPYEMTWQDHNDPKGYHIFDLDSRSIEFVQNMRSIFVRLDYDDSKPLIDLDAVELTDRFTRVVVSTKTDLYKFDQFMSKLYGKGCYEIKVIEDMSEFKEGDIGDDIDLEDTMDVVANYVDSLDTDADKESIKAFMKTLYIEAINADTV